MQITHKKENQRKQNHMKKVFDSRNWLNIILAAGFIIALMCGIAGWFQYYAAEGKQISFWTSVYLSLQL